jgi:hypothetical protein
VRVNRSRRDLGSGSGEIVSVSQLFGSRLRRFASFACGQRLANVRLDVSGLAKKVDEVGSGGVGGVRGVKGGRLHGSEVKWSGVRSRRGCCWICLHLLAPSSPITRRFVASVDQPAFFAPRYTATSCGETRRRDPLIMLV